MIHSICLVKEVLSGTLVATSALNREVKKRKVKTKEG